MSLTDYSDIEQEISDAPEPKMLPAGSEVEVRIIAVRSGISDKNDCKWYQPVFDVPEDPMVMEFNDFFWELDKTHLDPKAYARALNKFRNFAQAIDLDYSRPFSWEDDLISKTGWAILGVKKDDTYGDGNTIKKYMTKR
jgi:hypothetical protein